MSGRARTKVGNRTDQRVRREGRAEGRRSLNLESSGRGMPFW